MIDLDARRAKVAKRWNLGNEIVLVGAGRLLPIEGSGDQTYPFLPHPEYRYLADDALPDAVVAFDPREGWTQFAPVLTQAQRVWESAPERSALPLAGLGDWIKSRSGRPIATLGCEVQGVRGTPELAAALREGLKEVRRVKEPGEVERMRRAAAATARGFAEARASIRPGATERGIQIELEAAFFRAGGERTAYGTIVGSGPNAAILHSTPSARAVGRGDLVLIDAGCEIDGYCADVTRTYVVTEEQRELHAVVLEAERRAIARCVPGMEYREIHLEAALDLARGLVHLGLLRGNAQDLVERDAHALFFPHGIGHLVGLGVRDGDSAPPRRPTTRPTLKYLRLDLPLKPGFTLTIEPGLYFIPALLDDPALRERHATEVDWARVDRMRDFGGIRIEDNLVITDGAPEVLTAAIPN